MQENLSLEKYFQQFRKHIIGDNLHYTTPYGEMKMIYADWVASGRLYRPIEEKMMNDFGPFVGNTHTETSEAGTSMTYAYHHARDIIKKHVNADKTDVLITAGFGMTAVVNKFQRILGLKICGTISGKNCLKEAERPVVFITHLEHHSNHTSWYETAADVVIVEPDEELLVSPDSLRAELEKYKNRPLLIGSFSACSNVTGIKPPIHQLAKVMHEYGGVCFADYAASAPYIDINMHPENEDERLDAVLFSPHKFLGGPGTSGVIIFNSALYKSRTPDHPGGGTVDWTNRWGEYKYIDDIELREDGGTPGFLQAIRTALCIRLKEQMKTSNIEEREKELVALAFRELPKIKSVHILADNVKDRLGIISFYTEKIHYNMIVKLLSDRFGIQVRGGCACAGTYGHYLLHVGHSQSQHITELINKGDLSEKPGWVRLSLHPTMTNDEVLFFADALKQVVKNAGKWEKDYTYSSKTNEFIHKTKEEEKYQNIRNWFDLD